jgi:hypothetical protein
MSTFPKDERDAVVRSIYELRERLFPAGGEPPDFDEIKERYYQRMIEYLDRLPREVLSVCPFTGEPLKRAIDPWGFDGPFWHDGLSRRPEEPRPPGAFQVLLGGLKLNREAPTEAVDGVKPGPDVPFVVPDLLLLPGMVAVMARYRLPTGDDAYPVAYFAEDPSKIEPRQLHQEWLRPDYWFENDDGDQVWSIANEELDFELRPYLESGQLRWVDDLAAEEPRALRLGVDADECPLLDLPGERKPQLFSDGQRDWLPLPDGSTVSPFEYPDEEKEDPEAMKAFLEEDKKKAEDLPDLEEIRKMVEGSDLGEEEKAIWRQALKDAKNLE